jgi:uncharacterized protein (TIGR00304 family)
VEGKTLIGNILFLLGFFIIFIGFLIIIAGIVLGTRKDSQASGNTSNSRGAAYERSPGRKDEPETKSEVKAGGVIMIGPIPIIFGSDKESAKTAIILAIILMLLSLLLSRGFLF